MEHASKRNLYPRQFGRVGALIGLTDGVVGTESETIVVVVGTEATTGDAVVTESTVGAKWAEAANGVVVSTPIPMKSCAYQ